MGKSASRDGHKDDGGRQKKTRTSQPSSPPSKSVSGGGKCVSDEDFVVDVEEREHRSISVTLTEPDVLDCSICFEPLTVPVFQCRNGHIACSTCCSKLGNRCPSCSQPIGRKRCRAIEKVLEAIKVSCSYDKYGCEEKVRYCDKLAHEEICVYAPCWCPFPDCDYSALPRALTEHTIMNHFDDMIGFCYNSTFSVEVSQTDGFLVLQEWREGVLFILNMGCKLAIRCVERNTSDGKFNYHLNIRSGSNSFKFQSVTKTTTGQTSDIPLADYFQVPEYLFDADDSLMLDIYIWSKDAAYSDIAL